MSNVVVAVVDTLQLHQRREVWSDWSAGNDQESSGANVADGGCFHGCHQAQCLRSAAGLRTGNTPELYRFV